MSETPVIRVTSGSTTPWQLLVRRLGSPESLALVTAASMEVKTSVGAADPTVEFSLAAGDLAVVSPATSGELRASPTISQAAALTPGVYVADLSIEFGSGSVLWTERFYVRVSRAVSAAP